MNKMVYRCSNFTIGYEYAINEEEKKMVHFIFESCSKNTMYLTAEEMVSLLNGLMEVVKEERNKENDKCFAYSKQLDYASKYLMATRIGDTLKVRLLEFEFGRRSHYQEIFFDLSKDNMHDLASCVLQTLHLETDHLVQWHL